ncbi:ACP S-malonyltransferase [Sorangium sp. So ce887]|uniref:ACP S-malonyltransferase n=1 Tax=Sorangium sp. So ce887 TaxID=3133324 RepID=UPI003F622202
MTTRSIVFMFSGQGSQYYQMGKELFRTVPAFRQCMLRLDERVKSAIGVSVLDHLYDEKRRLSDRFDRTLLTHPAIFMVEYALAQALIDSGVRPDYVVGASMGELTAAAVAGALPADDALELVIQQARALETHARPGAMLAVIHDPELYRRDPMLSSNSELGSVVFDAQFVVSGTQDHLLQIESHLKRRDVVCVSLPVTHAFHSSLIDPAGPHYQRVLDASAIGAPRIPMISSVDGRPLERVPRHYFWDVVRQPIQLPKALLELERQQNHVYLDLGPGGTLANVIKRNITPRTQSAGFATMTMYHQDVKNFNLIVETWARQPPAPAPAPVRPAAPAAAPVRSQPARQLTAYVFPGQGSQVRGMGGALFDELADLTARADRILGYSIKDLCLNDPEGRLGQTQYTQPALYVVNALSYLKKVRETGFTPDYVAGHSLGEYNALFAAGVFDFETGLKLVKKRGELMSQAQGGGMAAVVGLTKDQVQDVLEKNGLTSIDLANYNSSSQLVIAGLKDDIANAQPIFQAAGVRAYIPLKVSGAFHSRYMAIAERSFEAYLDTFTFSPLSIPVISNIHARPYEQAEAKRNLVKQLTHQVKWFDSMQYLLALGEIDIHEVGPGNVLTKLTTAIRREARS